MGTTIVLLGVGMCSMGATVLLLDVGMCSMGATIVLHGGWLVFSGCHNCVARCWLVGLLRLLRADAWMH